jgi:NADH:ubiquinone oxidoreductase subunit 5 (subunit L)/multisubunit Na+/H+ antiporter MnhA subunit
MVVLALGGITAALGVLYALMQHDLKRLLAYHTVENIGIILLGIGIGMIGVRSGHPVVAMLGFAGALLHMLNHALFKALLFLGAGSVVHATGTGEMDALGGLARRMPWTAIAFLVGCVSICALPPGNGFVSEWSVYRAAFAEATGGSGTDRVACLLAVLALALIGGLAAACFAKAFATVFLGEPRSARSAGGHDAPPAQRIAMAVLASACIAIGVFPHLAARAVWPAVRQVGGPLASATDAPEVTPDWWRGIATAAAILLALGIAVWLLRRAMRPGTAVGAAPAQPVATWGCGYAAVSPRMQYTSSSFATPLLGVFRLLLLPRVRRERPATAFPASPTLHTSTPDMAETVLYRPAFRGLVRGAEALRVVQRIPVQAQAALVMATLAALLLWKVAP